MKRVGDKRAAELQEYKGQFEADGHIQECVVCGHRASKRVLQRHHPMRRLNGKLFHYVYACAGCHDGIERGLYPEYLPRDNDHEKRFHGMKPGDNMLRNK